MQLYLYADHESAELLANAGPKALLIGSDFGNGNFGDVLQHIGAASQVRARTGFAIVSLCMLDTIPRNANVASLRKGYGVVDAMAFLTEIPIEAGVAAGLGLRPVEALCNLSYIQLYGGGFLNEMWGEFVLGITERFLSRLPGIPYVISGQQVSPGFVPQFLAHVERFAPRLVSVRDQASLDLLAAGGMRADFSFDDAAELLLDLDRRLELRTGDGVFIHLNASDYTGNDAALAEMAAHLQLVEERVGSQSRPVLFQAFQDAREVVVDSIETVKRLDAGFPFADVETVLLVTSMLGAQAEDAPPRLLTGRFGYSSSYHVTLWLQLHGIPCWLRGSNPYYEQKRVALGIEGRFEDFLEHMHCPDHGGNLRARSLWLDKLQRVMDSIEPATNRIEWEWPAAAVPTRPFNFKGEPRYEQQLRGAWRTLEDTQQEVGRLGTALEQATARLSEAEAALKAGQSKVDILRARAQEHASERSDLLSRIEVAAEARAELKAKLRGVEDRVLELNGLLVDQQQSAAEQKQALEETRESLLACNEQLTAAGDDVHYYREQHAKVSASMQEASAREQETTERLRACNEQLTALGGDVRYFREQYLQVHTNLQEAMAREQGMVGRLQACNEQLTAVGHDARHYHDEYHRVHADLHAVRVRERELAARMQEVLRSRSWRWTRPFRVGGRYLRTGRFDPAGRVGLFGALRAVGRRMPLSQSLRSSLGEFLARFRRH